MTYCYGKDCEFLIKQNTIAKYFNKQKAGSSVLEKYEEVDLYSYLWGEYAATDFFGTERIREQC